MENSLAIILLSSTIFTGGGGSRGQSGQSDQLVQAPPVHSCSGAPPAHCTPKVLSIESTLPFLYTVEKAISTAFSYRRVLYSVTFLFLGNQHSCTELISNHLPIFCHIYLNRVQVGLIPAPLGSASHGNNMVLLMVKKEKGMSEAPPFMFWINENIPVKCSCFQPCCIGPSVSRLAAQRRPLAVLLNRGLSPGLTPCW